MSGVKNPRPARAKTAVLVLLCLAWSCQGVFKNPSPGAPSGQSVTQARQWDEVFTRHTGWTGGDVAASFLIPGDRVLWVFGDSFVGAVENNRRVRSALVNNAIALHPCDPSHPGKAPAPDQVEFYWGPPDAAGRPTAWLKPRSDENPRSWYWPTGGGVVLPYPERGFALALFFIQLEKRPGDDSVWGFKTKGSELAMIDNVAAPAPDWRPRIIELPLRLEQQADSETGEQFEWGVAALYQPVFGLGPDYVFIYGTRSRNTSQRELVLARARPENLEQFEQWEFFAGKGQWLKSPLKAVAIVKSVASEISVDKIAGPSGTRYLMVYSEPLLGSRIFLRSSCHPEGPWSDFNPVFTVPETLQGKTLFAYAAKGHAALSEPGTLLISYIVSSNEFSELLNNSSLYRPRFLTLN
jgi:hypothetical protein